MNTLQTLIAQHKTIVFDLDGTLMHTEPDIRLAANQALKDCGFEPIAPTCVIPNLFGPLYDILGSIMSVVDAPPVAADDIMQAYLKHYADQSHDNSFLYPGVRTLLDQLLDHGCALGVPRRRCPCRRWPRGGFRAQAQCSVRPPSRCR